MVDPRVAVFFIPPQYLEQFLFIFASNKISK
jgi:hypothetical protein